MKKTIFTLFLLLAQWSMFNAQCSMAYAQDLYIGSFYVTSTDEEALYGDGKDKWATRMPHISNLFQYEQPDVLGLQSLTASQLSTLSLRTRLGSAFGFAGDILYNLGTMELDTCGVLENMPEGSTCSWAKLRKEGTAFYVFNFCFSTELTIASQSASTLVTTISSVNTENLPCFLIGDLGVNETKTAYTRLKARYNDCYVSASVKSAEYGTKNNFDLENNHESDRYDFVFAPKNATVKSYGQLQSAYFTRETDGSYKRRLLSTHFPVMAKVKLP